MIGKGEDRNLDVTSVMKGGEQPPEISGMPMLQPFPFQGEACNELKDTGNCSPIKMESVRF